MAQFGFFYANNQGDVLSAKGDPLEPIAALFRGKVFVPTLRLWC